MTVDNLTVLGLLKVLRQVKLDELTVTKINELSGEDLSELVSNLADIQEKLTTIQTTINDCKLEASVFKTSIADAIKNIDSTATVTEDSSLTDFASDIENILSNVTSDATATSSQILSGYTAYVKGTKVTGTISQKVAATYTPGTSNQIISAGQYLSGNQTVAGDANLVVGNIKSGVNIFGVSGTFTSDANATASQVLSGKTAYVKGSKVTGTMNNYSGVETSRGATANITSVVKDCNIDVGGYYGIVSFHPCFTGYIDASTVINQTIYGLNPNVIKAGQLIGAYGGSGDSAITGTFTSDATATSSILASGYTAYVNGSKITGALPQLDGGSFGDNGSSSSFDNSPIVRSAYNSYVGAFDYPLYGYFPSGEHRVHIPNLLPNNIKAGVKVGGKNGYISGTFTSDANATSSQILSGYTAYVNGSKVTGTINNYTGVVTHIDARRIANNRVEFACARGYHDYDWAGNSYEYVTYDEILDLIGCTADKIMTGKSVLNRAGTGGGGGYKVYQTSLNYSNLIWSGVTLKEGSWVNLCTSSTNSTVILVQNYFPINPRKIKCVVCTITETSCGFRSVRGYNTSTSSTTYKYQPIIQVASYDPTSYGTSVTDNYYVCQYVDDNYSFESSKTDQNIIRVQLNYRGTVTLRFIYGGRNTYSVKYPSVLKFYLTVVYSE